MKHIHLEFRLAKRDVLLYDGPIWKGPTKEKTRFIIIGNWRVGSTVLRELINCHPAIQCAEEVFNPKCITQKILFPCWFLEERVRESQAQAYGVSLKPDQIQRVLINKIMTPSRFLHKLHKKGWKFIRLKRQNVLRQALSATIARQSDQWHSRSKSFAAQKKIRIDCTHLLQTLQLTEQFSFMEDDQLQHIPHAPFFYEDDLLSPEQHQSTADRIFDFLSLPPAPVRAQLVRLSTDDISASIENYSEIVSAVSQSKFAHFLNN